MLPATRQRTGTMCSRQAQIRPLRLLRCMAICTRRQHSRCVPRRNCKTKAAASRALAHKTVCRCPATCGRYMHHCIMIIHVVIRREIVTSPVPARQPTGKGGKKNRQLQASPAEAFAAITITKPSCRRNLHKLRLASPQPCKLAAMTIYGIMRAKIQTCKLLAAAQLGKHSPS